MNVNREKLHVVVDIGPYTMMLIAEMILIILKILQYIKYSWLLVLSPIMLIVMTAFFILLTTFVKLLKNYLF